MDTDPRLDQQYGGGGERTRLTETPKGNLTRLRTWDVFDRFLPPGRGRVLDVGGGPGIHAAHLAGRGYDVALIDPVADHVEEARARAEEQAFRRPDAVFSAQEGDARALPFDDASADAVLLLGPLYHLFERQERLGALREAHRVLRPGGVLVAEAITPHAWLLDAARLDLLGDVRVWEDVAWNLTAGCSQAPSRLDQTAPDASAVGGFWCVLQRPEHLAVEVAEAGFGPATLVAVEGWAWLLGDLGDRLEDPDRLEDLLRALRLTESEPSMLGVSPHVIAVATRP
jgi:SAM-dependent methyltransferase